MSESFTYNYSAERQSEIEAIRKKYLPQAEQESKLEQLRKLDASLTTTAFIVSMAVGIASALVFGVGMCCFLVWSLWVPGALLCVAGVIGMLVAPVLYRRLVEKRKQEIAPEILRLTEELSQK
jgi:Flp pilus assembly protein TadB